MKRKWCLALCALMAATAVPGASGAAGFTWTESAVTVAGGDQVGPAVTGANVVYIDVTGGPSIVLWDTLSGTTRTLDNGPAVSPDIDGTHVAYVRSASGGNDIATYDLASGTRKVLSLAGDQ